MTPDLAVEAVGLQRTFVTHTGVLRRSRKDVEAVKGVSFHLERGELFGLLGPNGAGKTTTIKMLITLLLPTGGTARVLGHDVVDDVRAARLLADGSGLGAVGGLLLRETGIGLLYTVAGLALLRFFENESRRSASLDRV
jgi:ABC-type multidrug transport system ATPase subunit